MVQIRWSEKAAKHLQQIYDYIANDSKTYAFRFIKSLIRYTVKLEDMPRSGRVVPEFNDENIRELIFKNYRIVYRYSNNIIEILSVIHSARDFESSY